MPYTYIALADYITLIADQRLDDPNNIYWSRDEITLYIQEAIRTWQSLSGYYRGRMKFNTQPGITAYDLSGSLSGQLGVSLAFSQTDQYVETGMAYQLLETPPSGSTWNGTSMFTADDFTQSLQRRRNQFLVETGMIWTRSLFNWPSPPIYQFGLSDTTIDIRRAAWVSAAGKYSTLWRSSEFAGSAFRPGWNLAPNDPPLTYTIAAEPPVTMALMPPPLNPGQIELFSVITPADLNPDSPVTMNIPDCLVWVVKFGALADLLSKEGPAQDLERAAYCEQRWREGINIARINTSVVQAAINGVYIEANAVASLDTFTPGWENKAPGKPTSTALGGWNMLFVSGPPDSGPYSIQLDVIQNAPIPVDPADKIQIGREELDALTDYVQHLAMFKMGGSEFLDTAPFYDRFLRVAGLYNERLKAAVDFAEPMSDRAIRDEILVPRRVPIEQSQQGG